jgi:DNA-directed RNA polymerase subunit RPC12/RpoP
MLQKRPLTYVCSRCGQEVEGVDPGFYRIQRRLCEELVSGMDGLCPSCKDPAGWAAGMAALRSMPPRKQSWEK